MYKTSIILLILAFCSCQKEIQIRWPDQDPKMVVNCLFSDAKPFEVQLIETANINDSSYRYIANANVTISTSQGIFENLVYTDNGKYVGTFIPNNGVDYFLKVEHPDYDVVTAKSSIPAKNIPISIQYLDTAGIHQWGKPFSQINFSFFDPVNEKNFYEIGAFMIGWDRGNYYVTEVLWPYSVTDPVLTTEDILDYDPNTYVFSDDLIDGSIYNLKIPVEFLSAWNNTRDLHFYFISASKEYYSFKKNLIKHLFNQGGRELDFMIISAGNPLPVYTNIENGYGIFAGLSIFHDIYK